MQDGDTESKATDGDVMYSSGKTEDKMLTPEMSNDDFSNHIETATELNEGQWCNCKSIELGIKSSAQKNKINASRNEVEFESTRFTHKVQVFS